MTSAQRTIGVLIGSLRRASLSRKLAKALIARAPEGLACSIIEIAELPLYNEDLESKAPTSWTRLRKAIQACDALLFVTPEYNRSIPGCLKNATDIGSRPEGRNVFAGLPAGVVSCSPYGLGGFGANHALRQNFVYLDLDVMQQPEAYIGDIGKLMDAHGIITQKKTDAFLTSFMDAFARWVARGAQADEDFDAFLARREAASLDYINGRSAPLMAMATDSDPATFFPPSGNRVCGATSVKRAHDAGAKGFRKGSLGSFEVMQSGSGGGFGFWTGVQHAEVMMADRKTAVEMQMRTTEVFRLEAGAWRLVHRHADMVDKTGKA